jgi:ankyrin repeat protein
MLWHYFRSPFPKAEGFSAYRMPGIAVHGPVILLFVWLGAWLCLGEPWTYPLLIVYLIAGLYLGRDLAILAHYNPLITIAVLGGTIWLVASPPQWERPAPLVSVAATLAVAVGLALCASWWVRRQTEGEPRLHRLILSRDLKAVERALDEGADPNEQDTLIGWKYAPLHVAVALPEPADTALCLAMIELLVKRGADLNSLCDHHGTPLGLAVLRERTPLALRLLALGADPDRFGEHGTAPLHVAARRGDREMVEALIAAGASLEVRSCDMSVLGHAALEGQFDLLAWLIEKGARSGPGDEVLANVAASRHPQAVEMFQLLADAGAQVADDLLMVASTPEMIRFVAARGARPDGLLKRGKNPALVRHDTESRPERLRVLRELGCDLAAADQYGQTILHDTASYFEGVLALPRILAELRGSGIDVNAADGEGATALHLMVRTLLPYVIGRNIVGLKEKLPVKDALQPLDALLEAGADPRLPGKDGNDAVAIARQLKAPRPFLDRLEQGRSGVAVR